MVFYRHQSIYAQPPFKTAADNMKTLAILLALGLQLHGQTPTPAPITAQHTLEWDNPKEATDQVKTYEIFEATTPPKLVATVSAPAKFATFAIGPGAHTYYVIARTTTRQSAPSASHVVSAEPSAPIDLKTKMVITIQTP